MSSRLKEFIEYHGAMQDAGDIDPSYPMLRYVCDRFELNSEQRYWLAFLFASCYCAPTVYYIYNEFPDYETVDVDRLQRWWDANREKLLFQTDRRWVRSRNQFVDIFKSYRALIGSLTQQQKFLSLKTPRKQATYRNCYQEFSQVYQFGRFALFLYLEAVHVVTGYPMEPDTLDLKEAESSRNGVAYALGYDQWITGKETGKTKLNAIALSKLQSGFWDIVQAVRQARPGQRADIWNVETTLCAYKKYKRGDRYVGYYLDRQGKEIQQLQSKVKDGVDWSVLWDFREETFGRSLLLERR